MKHFFPQSATCGMLLLATSLHQVQAQTETGLLFRTTEGNPWQMEDAELQDQVIGTPEIVLNTNEVQQTFKGWGTCFSELGYDALSVLPEDIQQQVMQRMFAPDGDLRFTIGRIPVGANDYARSWYSCDEMEGDLELRYFNIERDKQTIIPFIRAAQKYNPGLTFWVSPWCPPSWMKINHDYPVLSSRFNKMSPQLDYLLYGNVGGKTDPDEMKLTGERKGKFPRQLATTDYFIQDPRYLQAYANYFCKFITAYAEQGIPIDMVIYQNEAYSYTPYPGCAWTAEGTVRFNRDFLGPTLKREHPEVKLYLGTFNTNRVDYVQKIASDKKLQEYVSGMAFQWEGREALPVLREEHPEWNYMCSESECGWGSFDWKAGEHTFELINQTTESQASPIFVSRVLLEDIPCEQGQGYSKKESQQIAAKETLQSLKQRPAFLEQILRRRDELAEANISEEDEGDMLIPEDKETATKTISLNTEEFDLSDISMKTGKPTKEDIIAAAESAAYNDTQAAK